MFDRRIVFGQLLALVALTAAYQVDNRMNALAWAALAVVVGLQLLKAALFRHRQRMLMKRAREEYWREYRERMNAELELGRTTTAAEFLVDPVMQKYWPNTPFEAVLYLHHRGQAVDRHDLEWAQRLQREALTALRAV